MIRVVIVLVPGGDEDRSRVLDTIDIVNTTGLNVDVADYVIDGQWRIAHRRENGARVLAAKALMAVHNHRRETVIEHAALTDTTHRQLELGETPEPIITQLTLDEAPDV